MSDRCPRPANASVLPLRLNAGSGWIAHGYAKLARGPAAFIAILHAIGMPLAHVSGRPTIVVQITGGSLILLGAWVPVAAVPMIFALPVAIVTVHLRYGFNSIKLLSCHAARAHFGQAGYATALLYLAGLLALQGRGPGFDGRVLAPAPHRLTGGLTTDAPAARGARSAARAPSAPPAAPPPAPRR